MMQARRNPSRAATKSQASVRVQRQCPVLAACSRDVPARIQTKRRSPSRIADLRIQSARRKQGATHRTDCVRRSRMSAQSDGVTGWSGITWQASWKIRVSSVGRRDTLVAMRRHNDFSSHGKAIRLAECGRGYAQRFQRLTPRQSGVRSWGSVIRRAYGRCLVGEQVNWSGGQARAYAWQVRVRCCISCIMNVTDHR
jgi:hypothetical protein